MVVVALVQKRNKGPTGLVATMAMGASALKLIDWLKERETVSGRAGVAAENNTFGVTIKLGGPHTSGPHVEVKLLHKSRTCPHVADKSAHDWNPGQGCGCADTEPVVPCEHPSAEHEG